MSLTPICFMVMPYGKRDTGLPQPAPSTVDFDLLWEKALVPLIRDLGYEPVRADQDLGALIITEMLERLYFSDLVIADVSIPNGNVYYEIGIRHAAKKTGCVLIGADWSKPLFDIDQMRQVRYPLKDSKFDEETVSEIQTALKSQIEMRASADGPMFQALPGYPLEEGIDESRASSIQRQLLHLSEFQGRIASVKHFPKSQQRERAQELRKEVMSGGQAINRAAAIEVLFMLRDHSLWEEALEFIAEFPAELQKSPLILEQKALIQSKSGDHHSAIAGLHSLIAMSGDSSERQGLLGGRFKKLWSEAEDDADKRHYLDNAIEHYANGMLLDLNDYFPTCNLPRLYRSRGLPGDEKKAKNAVTLTYFACDRSLARKTDDEWLRPTLLGMAFEEGDLDKAKELTAKVKLEGVAGWKLQTTVTDLRNSLKNQKPSDERDQLGALCDELEGL